MNIIGISAFYHDSAACIIKNGEVICAAQEERFTRKRHDGSFPINTINFCLKTAGLSINEIDCIIFYENPKLKLSRVLSTYIDFFPDGISSFINVVNGWLSEKIWVKRVIQKQLGYSGKIEFSEHHLSHAASAFYPSPYKNAAFLTIDGVGEWATTSFGVGRGNNLEIYSQLNYPHSLGLLYSAFTYYLGFKVDSAEYKVMGLAPYGEPKYIKLILDNLIDLKDDGSFHLNMHYFDYCVGRAMTNDNFDRLFAVPRRKPESEINQFVMDVARSLQAVTELVVMKIANNVYRITDQSNLCMAGGVALNCVANGKLLRDGPFENIWIQPAAGDAGSAIGAALHYHYKILGAERNCNSQTDGMSGSLLGPEFSDSEIEQYLIQEGIPFEKFEQEELDSRVVDLIASGNVVGWFQGKMEFGPRSLGNRSILGDPRNLQMQKIMNLRIKNRESFRPFAPSVLLENASEYFDICGESPYMLTVANVSQKHQIKQEEKESNLFGLEKLSVRRSSIPAVTHVDYSARVQTVDGLRNNRFYKLLKKNLEKHNCPLLINTSFNERGEPIVCTPQDAFRCFMNTGIDFLVLGSHLLSKKEQDPSRFRKTYYELD